LTVVGGDDGDEQREDVEEERTEDEYCGDAGEGAKRVLKLFVLELSSGYEGV
jgi:hypothetical protein